LEHFKYRPSRANDLLASCLDLHACSSFDDTRRLKHSLPLHLHNTDAAKSIGGRGFMETDRGNILADFPRNLKKDFTLLGSDFLSVNY
jgi:hypothetical protein